MNNIFYQRLHEEYIHQINIFKYESMDIDEIAENYYDLDDYEKSKCINPICKGSVMKVKYKSGGCSCHLVAPCSSCTSGYELICDECNFYVEYEGA